MTKEKGYFYKKTSLYVLFFCLGLFAALTIYAVTAVQNGDPLTADMWNALPQKGVQVYQCPKTTELAGAGNWASYGCVGQISFQSTCPNYVWNGGLIEKTFSCTTIGYIVN